jgi:Transposase DDE domain
MLPNDFPPWPVVYQQFLRSQEAGCFEALVSDMRSIIRTAEGRRGPPIAVIFDGRTLQTSCKSGLPARYDNYRRPKGSKVHMAVDTLGHLLTSTVTLADKHERVQVDALFRQLQQATGETVKMAWAHQGYTGEQARGDAAQNGIELRWRHRSRVETSKCGAHQLRA